MRGPCTAGLEIQLSFSSRISAKSPRSPVTPVVSGRSGQFRRPRRTFLSRPSNLARRRTHRESTQTQRFGSIRVPYRFILVIVMYSLNNAVQMGVSVPRTM